ncbi:MAG TPA: M2 family metallopeptidase [Azospirillaceae bacterium]|nr:M2 family metallopeptidase [Azospirillaceae bacterium]
MSTRVSSRRLGLLLGGAALLALSAGPSLAQQTGAQQSAGKPPTVEEARAFVEAAEKELAELGIKSNRAAWVRATYITPDTNQLAADADLAYQSRVGRLVEESKRFNGLTLTGDLARKMEKLKLLSVLPPPADPKLAEELSRVTTELQTQYDTGKACLANGECKPLDDISETLRTSRDPKEMLDVWTAWHKVAPPMKPLYAREVEIANQGAREMGFKDVGALWRSNYDMDPDAFAAETDRLWGQVKPLYESLHCHVRAKLVEKYGDAAKRPDGRIPAHLLGNMWAQEWSNVYDLVAPGSADPGYDLTKILRDKGYDAVKMTRTAEGFFTSLGFTPLPQTFWERSMLVRPKDREVTCHASAWDIDDKDDIRIKMCMQVTAEDFQTVHHELGHNFYQRAYKEQPYLFRSGANDGFHEAIGDFVALSITPKYLVDLKLLDREPAADKDLGLLMNEALRGVAFLPFGLLVDKWRWQVFAGEVGPDSYNKAWWDLRAQYQGVAAPVARTEADFDPGAKNHIPGNTPYMRYFLARILQFQFHQAACQQAGYKGPLHRCSVYGDKEVGKRFNAMLEMGQSKPWPEALNAFTGTRQMDGSAMLAYFKPLKDWLDQQNQGRQCGWQ